MPRIAELRRTVQRKTDNIYDTLFTRRASVYITAMLAPLGVRPNHVSVACTLVGLAACALIALGVRWQVILGASLIHIYAVLDSVDGELARLQKRYSLKGLFIEDLSAYLMLHAMNLAVAGYLYRQQGEMLPLWIAISIAGFFHHAMPVARRALFKSLMTARPVSAAARSAALEGTRRQRGWLMRVARYAIKENLLHLMTIWAILAILILIEQLAEVRRLVLYGFYFFAAGLIAKELAIYVHLLRGDRLERELALLYQAAASVPAADAAVDGLKLAEY